MARSNRKPYRFIHLDPEQVKANRDALVARGEASRAARIADAEARKAAKASQS